MSTTTLPATTPSTLAHQTVSEELLVATPSVQELHVTAAPGDDVAQQHPDYAEIDGLYTELLDNIENQFRIFDATPQSVEGKFPKVKAKYVWNPANQGFDKIELDLSTPEDVTRLLLSHDILRRKIIFIKQFNLPGGFARAFRVRKESMLALKAEFTELSVRHDELKARYADLEARYTELEMKVVIPNVGLIPAELAEARNAA
ncbi:hypothetical protein B0H16DRAFT_1736233 [Mycena metata]|uniref:Uncharacterized protein n=1 Tax=Mycena metata TaxID=1033252 RepID=A0AAD7HPJ9_9AGAR|nr:hypothetical protein B0H16DRAFT_1736233 [Mycena metata]